MKFKEPTSDELIKIIFNYVSQISVEVNVDRLLVLLANMGRELVVCDRCTVWIYNRKENIIWTKVAHGIERLSIPFGKGIVSEVIKTGNPLIINDPYNDSRFDKQVDKNTGYKTNNIIAIPIKDIENNVIGVYQAINKMTNRNFFTEHDLERLMLAATYVAKELEAVKLYEEIVNTQKEIIFTMAEIGEMRSQETGNHVKRVAEYSYILAKAYGLDEKQLKILKFASPMHDIGKVAIPDSILLKKGRLTPEEREYMKKHTVFGYKMLRHSNREIIKTAAIIAYEHHEKWDGTGYPRGLIGEEIHIFGRITALADIFDALSSDRCYKKAWELDRVYKLIKEERGKHFEPALVDVFFSVKDDILDIKEKYKDKFDIKEEENVI